MFAVCTSLYRLRALTLVLSSYNKTLDKTLLYIIYKECFVIPMLGGVPCV